MAEAGNDGQPAASPGQPNVNVLTQYVKDFSFENPGAPQSLRARTGEAIAAHCGGPRLDMAKGSERRD